MFLAFTASALLAGVFVHLGALTVKVKVLAAALVCASAIATASTLLLIRTLMRIRYR